MVAVARKAEGKPLPNSAEKGHEIHSELARTVTHEALPAVARAEAGVLLDAEGLHGQSSLRLAPDGHVGNPPPKNPLSCPF